MSERNPEAEPRETQAERPDGAQNDATDAAREASQGEEATAQTAAANPGDDPEPEVDLDALLASGELHPAVSQALQQAKAEVKAAEDKMLRAVAESQNERRRLAKDQQDRIRFANERLLSELLPVLDNLELCLAHAGDGDAESLRTGVEMTVSQFKQTMENVGAVPVEATVGDTFDPKLHDAIMQDDNADLPARTIASVMQPGYTYQDRVLRPAKVSVSTGKGHKS